MKDLGVDKAEVLTIVTIGSIAIFAMLLLRDKSAQIVSALGSGLVGYLTKGVIQGVKEKK